MTVRDAHLQFASALALTNGTAIGSTNVIDLSILGRSLLGDMLLMLVWTGTPAGTSLNIDLRSTDQDTGVPTTDLAVSPAIHWSSGVIPAADYPIMGFASGSYTLIKFPMPVLPQPNLIGGGAIDDVSGYKRYLGMFFTSVGDNSAGRITAELVSSADVHHYAPSGFSLAALV